MQNWETPVTSCIITKLVVLVQDPGLWTLQPTGVSRNRPGCKIAILRLAEQGGGEICGWQGASTGTSVQPSPLSAPRHLISSGKRPPHRLDHTCVILSEALNPACSELHHMHVLFFPTFFLRALSAALHKGGKSHNRCQWDYCEDVAEGARAQWESIITASDRDKGLVF